MKRRTDAWQNWCFRKMIDNLVHTAPTTTLPKWMFFQKLFFKSSFLLSGWCGIQFSHPTATTTFVFSLVCFFFYAQWWALSKHQDASLVRIPTYCKIPYNCTVNENNWKPYTVAVFCCTFYFNLLVNVGHKCRILFTRVCSVCLEVKTTFNRLKVRNWAKRAVLVFLDNSLRGRILREQLAQCTGCYHAFRLRATVRKWWLDH